MAGTMTGNPTAGTGSADVLATTGKSSGGGGGWRYTDAPVRGTRSMIVLDRSHEKILLNQAGHTKPVDFEPVPCHTGFEIWRQNLCTR